MHKEVIEGKNFMSTKDVVNQILKLYRLFLKGGEGKKAFTDQVCKLLDDNEINNDDILEIIKLRQKQSELSNISALKFALSLAVPIFTSGIAAILGVWSIISNTINLSVTKVNVDAVNFVDGMSNILQMTADKMLESILLAVAGFILYIIIAIVIDFWDSKKIASRRRCYEVTIEILNKRKDKEKRNLEK